LETEFAERTYFDEKFSFIKSSNDLTGKASLGIDGHCLEELVNTFESSCIKFSDYGLKYVSYLAEMCSTTRNHTSEALKMTVLFAC